jgi:hypothetical protein
MNKYYKYILVSIFFLSGCIKSPTYIASLDEGKIKFVTDIELCNTYESGGKYRTESVLGEVTNRAIDCKKYMEKYKQNKISRYSNQKNQPEQTHHGGKSSSTAKNVSCPKTKFSNLSGEEAKAIGYLVNKKISSSKSGPETVCIEKIVANDTIKIRGNKLIQYTVTVFFPEGYRVECHNAQTRLNRRGSFNWDDYMKSNSGGCGFASTWDSLGDWARPGERRNINGEDEI